MRHPYVWMLCRLAARTPPDTRPIAERQAADRAAIAQRVAAVADDGLVVVNYEVPVGGGTVVVRSYRSPGDAALPAHLLLHGGGFWAGSVDNVDWLARYYATQADCQVLSVDYRQPPENPWPTANEDVYAVLQWVAVQGATIGVDASRLSLGGVSAGGHIAASVALLARDRGGPALCFQLLEIPMTDLTMSQPSIAKFASGYVLTRADIAESYDLYVPDVARRADPDVSPFFAQLAGLPPSYVVTCQYDPLRDEGEAYAQRLTVAGVPTQHCRARGMTHSTNYLMRLRSARKSVERSAAALRAALHPS